MTTTFTIARTSSPPGSDYEHLRSRMLEHAQALAHRVWTDFNIHDPGVTAIENLCYALTDLSYRTAFPIEDLLTNEKGILDGKSQAFFTARDILPNRPLTLLDYRKLLIDLPKIKNAWLKPATPRYFADPVQAKLLRVDPGTPGIRQVDVRGIYQVLLEFEDGLTSNEQEMAKESARQTLHKNRNLCEDFVSFDVVDTQSFRLCAELELLPDADTAIVQAQVLFKVQEYLAPPVPSYSLNVMLKKKHADGSARTIDEIFDGPVLDCGFIDDEELAEAGLREEIRLSDIISIIMDIPGVAAVREIVINPAETEKPLENKWILKADGQKKAQLDFAKSRLVFYKKNMPVTPAREKVAAKLKELEDSQRAKLETRKLEDLEIPAGTFRNAALYYSFQNHFPAVYGLSEAGLPLDADEKRLARRKVLALQLKAYLLFFDEILANYLAQLSHVRDLFSTDSKVRRTYFRQDVKDFSIPGTTKVKADDQTDKEIFDYEMIRPNDQQDKKVDLMLEDDGLRDARRNRFLDHLIARFAERFHEYVSVMHSEFGASQESIISTKCQFLKDYPVISSERALAFNSLLRNPSDRWNSQNISGLEKRLARLLGIADCSRRNLAEIVLDQFAKVEQSDTGGFRFRLVDDNGKILLGSSVDFPNEEQAKQELKRALHYAQRLDAYNPTKTSDDKFSFNILDKSKNLVARRFASLATEAQRDAAIQEVWKFAKAHYPEREEGMFLIENLLLRPTLLDDAFLPICVDPHCTDCAEDDPYSYRIHVVLPAFAGRFSNMDFRRFAEEVLREESPAHILPKICWADWEDMSRLQKAYREWLELDAAAPPAQKKDKLAALIEILFRVKNVYPSNKLHECAAGDEKPKFLLDQTALGTEEEKDS